MPLNLSDNPFQLFGLPVAFRVDAAALEKKYRELQLLLHPDRYASASEHERRLAAQASARVNDAYRVLTDECERATCLLEISGVEVNEETEKVSDADFLMEQMSLRESLDDSLEAADPSAELSSLSEVARSGRREMLRHFEKAWQDGAYETARAAISKAKFFQRFSCEIGETARRVGQVAL